MTGFLTGTDAPDTPLRPPAVVTGDKRTLFVVPWDRLPDGRFRHCYVGTTDTDWSLSKDHPAASAQDRANTRRMS